ncbi:hypothetical protein, partial [uncultured Parasutterella sp.]|uniref:hypothetical protein n=1 Tax=uncultured Parasutterella sp. TaxID=1263098 RepID=UPI00272A42B4
SFGCSPERCAQAAGSRLLLLCNVRNILILDMTSTAQAKERLRTIPNHEHRTVPLGRVRRKIFQ